MKASEAKKISIKNCDLKEYVEKEITEDVKNAAESGNFETEVYVHKPDWYEDYLCFRKMCAKTLGLLGYTVKDSDGHAGGFSFDISWRSAK